MSRYVIHDCPQRSEAWFAARLGRLTGSCAADALATIKSGEAAARRDLRMRLIAERLTQTSQESGRVNEAMQWGIDHEAEALAAYEAHTGQIVTTVGFLAHTEHMAGCSPDAVIGDMSALVSVKCPKTATHIATLRDGRVPPGYLPQCLMEMWITGARYVDFVSYDPRLPEPLQLFIVRLERDETAIADFERKALAFLAEVDRELEAIRTLSDLRGQLTEAATA